MNAGDTRGQLTLLEPANSLTIKKWRCRCACGTVKVIQQNHLVSGATRSCGCLTKKVHRGFLDTLRNPQQVGRGA